MGHTNAVLAGLLAVVLAGTQGTDAASHTLKATKDTVHWGFFSKTLAPQLTVDSGDTVDVEMLSHHCGDDYDRMVKGDAGVESVYDQAPGSTPATYMRGMTGAGDGVHILTGPIFVTGAEPGDVISVEILDLTPRPNPDGKTFGSNAAAWWGFDYGINGKAKPPLADPTMEKQIEVTTIYEAVKDASGKYVYAEPVYQFNYGMPGFTSNCTGFTSFSPGVEVPCVDGLQNWTGYYYPGLVVPHPTGTENYTVNGDRIRIPANMHIGTMGLAPAAPDFVDSIPPMPNGGNLDNRRIGVGATMYYPVKVAGGLLSMGDAHFAQGDSELDGTAIEMSINGKLKITLHKAASLPTIVKDLPSPLLENSNEYVVHGFVFNDYLTELNYVTGINTTIVYFESDINKAMANTYVNTRHFIMKMGYTESEARTMITLGCDFGVTQLVDGNWGMHSVIPKYIFAQGEPLVPYKSSVACGTSSPVATPSTTVATTPTTPPPPDSAARRVSAAAAAALVAGALCLLSM